MLRTLDKSRYLSVQLVLFFFNTKIICWFAAGFDRKVCGTGDGWMGGGKMGIHCSALVHRKVHIEQNVQNIRNKMKCNDCNASNKLYRMKFQNRDGINALNI